MTIIFLELKLNVLNLVIIESTRNIPINRQWITSDKSAQKS